MPDRPQDRRGTEEDRPVVDRGHSDKACNAASADAVIADATAREAREDARQRRSEEASRAVMRRPERIALVDSSHSV